MIGLVIWLRRSSMARAFPGLVALAVVMLMARRGWGYEWNWALSNASTPTLLLSPVVAGLVAFDRSRRFTDSLQVLAETVVRPRVAMLGLAGWIWACAVWFVSVGWAGAIALHGGASGRPDPWVLLQAPMALLAAAFFGLAWGAMFRGPLSGPTAAVVCYAGTILMNGVGLPGVFWAGGATGSLIGAAQVPLIALTGVGLSAVMALVSLTWHEQRRLPTRRAVRVAAVVLTSVGMCLAAVTAGLFGGRDTYQETTRTPICVGREVVVCGPPDGRAVLTIAQTSLQGAIRRLAASGIPWRQRYYLAAGPRVFALSADAGQLQVATEDIRHGALSQHDLAATLAMPRVCEAFLGAKAVDEQLLAKQGRVLDWVTQALGRPETAPRAPTDVVAAFDALANCAPLRSTPP